MGFIGNKPADTFHTTVKQSFTPDSSTTSVYIKSIRCWRK